MVIRCRQAGVFELAGAERGVSAGEGCSSWRAGGVGMRGYRDASGMVIIPSIDREAVHDDSREFINFPVNFPHCNFFPLFNQYCLHLRDRGNSLRGSAPLDSPLQYRPYTLDRVKVRRVGYPFKFWDT